MPKLFLNSKLNSTNVFVYPKLPATNDFGFIRYKGSGLSNCLFVAARAYLFAQNNGWCLISPTWGNIILGPYFRNEKDKRHYFGLLKRTGISGFLKLFYLLTLPTITYESALSGKGGKIIIEGLGNYFEDLLLAQPTVKEFIYSIIQNNAISKVKNTVFKNIIGIHIRLGDFTSDRRTNLNWYESVVKEIITSQKNKYKFFVFSDGQDIELLDLLSIPQVERVFFGNSISDLIALSKCKLIIGSDSTFSGWASFLEQTPIIFPKRHFGKVLLNTDNELIDNGDLKKLKDFLSKNI